MFKTLLTRLLPFLRDLALATLWCAVPLALVRFGLRPLLDTGLANHPDLAQAVGRAMILAALLAGYFGFCRWGERRPHIAELAWNGRWILLSAAAGAGLMALSIGLLWIGGVYAFEFREAAPFPGEIVGLILIAATFEEVTFRAILFRLVEKQWGTRTGLVLTAVIFGAMHLGNAGAGPLTWVSVSLLGVMWAGVFALTRNLWAAAANHAAWNLTIFLSGLPLSGQVAWQEVAPLRATSQGSIWLSGGTFGPEDSVLTIAMAAVATGWIVRRLGRERV